MQHFAGISGPLQRIFAGSAGKKKGGRSRLSRNVAAQG
jgi:hypothetical protein